MFTGIIEEVGTIRSVAKGSRSVVLTVEAFKVLEGSRVGDSIAVNGVCLTVTTMTAGQFRGDSFQRQQSESGKSNGSRRAFWRAYSIWPY